MDAKQVLTDHQDIFTTMSNMFLDMLRFLMWHLIHGISILNDGLQEALQTLFKNLNFFSSDGVGIGGSGGLYNQLLPIFWSLLVVGLIVLGIMLMTNRIKQKAEIPTNLLLIVVVVIGMPTILTALSNLTATSVKEMQGDMSFMESIIKSNITDLTYLDENNFSEDALKNKNNLPVDGTIPIGKIIDPTETVDFQKANNKDVFESKLVVASDGTISVEKTANKNMLGITMLDSLYYRYKINWLILFVSSIVMLLVLAITGVKVARYIYEIAFLGIFALFVVPLDITTGQRTKKIINELISIFAVIIIHVMLLRLYGIGMSWTSTFDWLPALLLQLGFSFSLIVSPDIVQKVLGKDAGIGKELQGAAGTLFMANMAAQGIKGGVDAAGKLAGTAGKAAAGLGLASAAGAGAMGSGIKNAAAHFGDKFKKDAPSPANARVLSPNSADTKALSDGIPKIEDGIPKLQSGSADGDLSSAIPSSPLDASSIDVDSGFAANTPIKDNSTSSSAANGAPESKRVTREDTFASAFGKMVGNTRSAKNMQGYADEVDTAYNLGKNSVDKGWDEYKKQVPHVHAEIVEEGE